MNTVTTALERVLADAFGAMRERLEKEYDGKVSNFAVTGADVVSDAFAYVARFVIEERKMVTKDDLERLIHRKAKLLVSDVYRSAKRKRGRRSIKIDASLDDEYERDERMSKKSEARAYSEYRSRQLGYNRDLMYRAQQMMVDETMEKNQVTERNREIVRKVIFEGAKPRDVADAYNMDGNNVDQIVNRVRVSVVKRGPAELIRCYEMLEGWDLIAA